MQFKTFVVPAVCRSAQLDLQLSSLQIEGSPLDLSIKFSQLCCH